MAPRLFSTTRSPEISSSNSEASVLRLRLSATRSIGTGTCQACVWWSSFSARCSICSSFLFMVFPLLYFGLIRLDLSQEPTYEGGEAFFNADITVCFDLD